MSKVFIMRGVPGSGKSRWVMHRQMENKCSSAVVSADKFHYSEITVDPITKLMVAPVYDYKPENARKAHDSCLREYLDCLYQGVWQEIFVDNTNTQAWEIAPYYRLVEVAGYEVEIIWLRCPVVTSVNRNVHNVPEETIEKMAERLEREQLPQWWKQTIVTESL